MEVLRDNEGSSAHFGINKTLSKLTASVAEKTSKVGARNVRPVPFERIALDKASPFQMTENQVHNSRQRLLQHMPYLT